MDCTQASTERRHPLSTPCHTEDPALWCGMHMHTPAGSEPSQEWQQALRLQA